MPSTDEKKKQFYKRIKLCGLLTYIPMILAGGPLGGYFIGDYLKDRFGLASYIPLLFAAIGFAASARETVRIIKLAVKIEKNS